MSSTELLTIIEKDGRAAKDKDPNLSDAELKRLYATMLAARISEVPAGTVTLIPSIINVTLVSESTAGVP